MCRVSVIIPVWNTGAYLSESIESALKAIQGVPAEIILVDDHSTDVATIEIIDKYQSSYACIYAYKNKHGNKGAGSARNTGVAKASGEWLVFLDSDDVLMEESITRKLSVADDHKNVCWISSDFKYWWPDSNEEGNGYFQLKCKDYKIADEAYAAKKVIVARSPVVDVINDFMPVHTISVMMKKREFIAVGGFAGDLSKAEDTYLWMNMAMTCRGFAFIPEIHAKYRIRSDSLTHEDAPPGIWVARMLKKLYYKGDVFLAYRKELRKKISACYNRDCYFYRKKGEWINAVLSALRSIRWGTMNISLWKNLVASLIRRD